jgi:hypothetical protein
MGLAEDYRAAWLAGFDAEMARVIPEYDDITPQRWIPVEERLPDDGVRVLAWDRHGECLRVAYIDSIFYAVGFDDDTPICVSHWMPLPEPPEVK